MFSVVRKPLLLRGFIVSDFAVKQADFLRDVGEWMRTDRLKYREDSVDGLRRPARCWEEGKNFGKTLAKGQLRALTELAADGSLAQGVERTATFTPTESKLTRSLTI